jgi:hypothetical protein
MNLEDFIDDVDINLEIFGTSTPSVEQIKAKIYQRRSQMLVTSYIYYELDDNIMDDHDWQKFANQLRDLQNKYPKHCKIGFFDRQFTGWNGDTGAFLPLKDPYVIRKSLAIYETFKTLK